jgi:hypothetical protein
MQLTLNLKDKITTGKKDKRLAVPCNEYFLDMIDKQAARMNTDRANLAYRFIVEGMQKTMGELLMLDNLADEKLRDLL